MTGMADSRSPDTLSIIGVHGLVPLSTHNYVYYFFGLSLFRLSRLAYLDHNTTEISDMNWIHLFHSAGEQ